MPEAEPSTEIHPHERAEFLSIASHDLRGALANLRSYAALLLSRGQLDERSRRIAESMVRIVDRSLTLSRGVFDSLRHELGALRSNAERVELAEILARAVEGVRQEANRVGASLELSADPLLRARADGERLSYALGLLLQAAVLRAGGGSVKVSARSEGSRAVIEVVDDGPSPHPDELAFERDRAVIRERRLGPAFALCAAHSQLASSGAWVTACSPGRGLVVRIELPRWTGGEG